MAKLSLNMNGQANVFSARAAHLEEGPSCRRKEKKTTETKTQEMGRRRTHGLVLTYLYLIIGRSLRKHV